jgi:hypothetical protein
MFSSKKWSVLMGCAVIAAACFGVSTASADWMFPTGLYDHSSPSALGASSFLDGNQDTWGKFGDDGGNDTEPITGYSVWDLGAEKNVTGVRLWPRIHATATTFPKNVDFFYWTNDAANAHPFSPSTSDQIALDGNVLFTANRTLSAIHGAGEFYETAFSSGEQFQARYVGIRFNSSYDTPPDAQTTIADIQFNATITPEPNTCVLTVLGLIGLLCYAWRKGR